MDPPGPKDKHRAGASAVKRRMYPERNPREEGTTMVGRGAPHSGTPPAFRKLGPKELLGPLSELEKKFAPEALYVCGEFEVPLQGPRAAIVGTRRASEDGLAAARTLARFLAEHD